MILIVIICILAGDVSARRSEVLKIGAIFDTSTKHKERALAFAIQQLNTRSRLKIEPIVRHLSYDDPLEATSATCSLMKQGVVGIIGPSREHNSRVVQSICDDKDIPHLDIRWVDDPGSQTINFYPSQSVLTRLYIDVITAWGFENFVILYDNAESLKRMTRFLEMHDGGGNHEVVLSQLDKDESGNYRSVLKKVKKAGVTHFILDCRLEILREVLMQAQQVGLLSDKHYFFITNLDLHTLDLVPFQYSGSNITGIQVFNPQSELIQNLASFIYAEEIESDPYFGLLAPTQIKFDLLLIIDAIAVLGEVLIELSEPPKAVNCEDDDRWLAGTTITNLIKGNQHLGLSGTIFFDRQGYRNHLLADIIELKEGGIVVSGNWSEERSRQRLVIDRPPQEDDNEEKGLKHESFRVLISLIEPFARHKKVEDVPLTGNDLYEGFAIDLIHELSLIEGFDYTFLNQVDKRNGAINNVTKKWDGMIGTIIANEADLAIADLTITKDRQDAVDFTTPFMNLGISILYQKPRKSPPGFFSFAEPLAFEVWVLLAISYLTVSIVLFTLGRLCPAEWINPYPCIEEPEFLENQLSMRNCFWFVSGSVMQQGTEIGPLALPTRMVAGCWWFFTLIVVSSYTANLAVFLTKETPIPHFSDVFELVHNAESKNIKWGAKAGGSTVPFFKNSRDKYKEYGVIYDFMMANAKDVLVEDPTVGVQRAERENFAFFMESTSIEYEIQRRCNLTRVGKLLDEKSYGIAMKKNSTYRNVLSRALLDLQHSGKLNELKRKWWEEKRGGGFCESEDSQSQATDLNLKNVGGVFWVTIGGVCLAALLVIVELILHLLKVSIQTKTSFKEAFFEELRFYFRFSMEKPVIRNNPLDSPLSDS